MRPVESPKKSAAPQAIVALLTGALLGFAAGYFAGGGGRPGGAAGRSPAAVAPGDTLGRLTLALERDPENPELLIELGNFHYDGENWDEAIRFYEKARRKAPKNASLLSDLGAAHRNRGELELAVAYFAKARESDPDHWQALLNQVLVEAFDRRNPKAAQPLFDELKKRFPEIPQLDRIQEQISRPGPAA